MDEQAIRQWAWNEVKLIPERADIKVYDGLRYADEIAAWVMSGRLPALPVQPATDQ